MSIKFFTRTESGMQITVPPELIPEFINMVERANNTWQDRSKDMQDFRNKLVAIKKDLIAASKTVPFKCSECKTIPCSCTFTHY